MHRKIQRNLVTSLLTTSPTVVTQAPFILSTLKVERYLTGKSTPAIEEIPDPVDLAVILLPASAVPGSLRECGERGIPAAIISSGGFRETGPDGEKLEADCLDIARQFGMRLIGPNCVGLIGTHQPLNTTFLPHTHLPPGEIAFISQSGAICDIAIDWAISQGFGLSWLVSLGNQADVSESDILAPVAADPYTRVLAMYLEGVRDGCQFVNEASRAVQQKPVLVLKVGKSSGGQRAATSHTGALVGQENAYEAAFRKAGVIRAGTTEELFDWARALAWCPPIHGASIAILTNAGGLGVIASDSVEGYGLKLADLALETQSGLRSILASRGKCQQSGGYVRLSYPRTVCWLPEGAAG